MLKITFDKSLLKLRTLTALLRYLSNKYIEKVVTTDNTIFFTEQQVDILKKAALLEHALVEDNYIFYYKDVFNKEQSFTKEDLLTFASNVKQQSLNINYGKKVKNRKLTKERLQFMYADCVNKIYEQCSYPTLEDNIAKKINHYRQLLANNRDTWDYLSVRDMSSVDFYLKYNHKLKAKALNLKPELSIKDLLYVAYQIVSPYKSHRVRTIAWEIKQYAKPRHCDKGELYRIDNEYEQHRYLFKKPLQSRYVWLERIEFINGEVDYTEDYIQVTDNEVEFMILKRSILTNY
jgi:hypothetical protein